MSKQCKASLNDRISTKQATRNNKECSNYGYIEDEEEYWNGVLDKVKEFQKPTFSISVKPRRANNISPKLDNQKNISEYNNKNWDLKIFLTSNLSQKDDEERHSDPRSKSTMTKASYRSRRHLINKPNYQDCSQFDFESNNWITNNLNKFTTKSLLNELTKSDSVKRFENNTLNLNSENDYSILNKEKSKLNSTSFNFFTKCSI